LSIGDCQVNLTSVGYGDNTSDKPCQIALNGTVYPYPITSTGVYRGIGVMIVNSTTCQSISFSSFDTYESANESVRLGEFLKCLPNGTLVVGVACDSAKNYKTDTLAPVKQIFASLGVSDVTHMAFIDTLAFSLQVGNLSQTWQKRQAVGRGRIEALITLPGLIVL